nr:unnamed protein product [Spirometra erinaceieuropaei]
MVASQTRLSQDSVLVPLLYLIYINDCSTGLECDGIMIADDIMIWKTVRCVDDSQKLKEDIYKLAILYSQLEEVDAGYTFFWSGRPRPELLDASVAFAIRNDIVGLLTCLPKGINDLLINLYPPFRFDDTEATICNLLGEKNHLHIAYVDQPTDANRAAFYRSRRQLQQRLRVMQDAWTARKTEKIKGYADRNEWKNFFSAIKAVCGSPTKGTAPLLSGDVSTLLTEKT